MVYFFILLVIFCISAYDYTKINKLDMIFFIFLTVVAGFRYGVGTDYFHYVDYFYQGFLANAEPGFLYLSVGLAELGFNSQALFVVISTLTMFFLYNGIAYFLKNDYTNKPVFYFIMIIFFYFPSFNVIRQILASSIILYASRYIVERKAIKFYLLVGFAMLFHKTAGIFFFIYFIAMINWRPTTLITLLFLMLILSYSGQIGNFFEYCVLKYYYLDFTGKLSFYLYSSFNTRDFRVGLFSLLNLSIAFLCIIYKKKIATNEKAILCLNFYYLYILSIFAAVSIPMLTRLIYYFGIYAALAIPRVALVFSLRSRKTIELMLLFIYSFVFLYVLLNGYLYPDFSGEFPYSINFNLMD